MTSLAKASVTTVVKKVRSSLTTMAMVAKSSVKVQLRRNLSTSLPAHMAGNVAPGGGFQFWKKAFFFGAVPAIILGHINAFLLVDEDAHARPEFVPYEYLRIRTKKFPWGDGNHSLFHNPHVNPLPDGYEDENE